ncbi:MAG: hypothetical protein JWQ23_2131 [Herminiimonas sp.]|jgi:hypothetical protein|nr:hypothetical protein [Herminiimonas sp.]
MSMTDKPSKEQVRDYMLRRQGEHRPPPDQVEIRRQLGWDLIEMARREQKLRKR